MAEPTTVSLLAEFRNLVQGNVQENLAKTTAITAYLLERSLLPNTTVVSTSYTMTAANEVLLVDATMGGIQLTLPVLTENQSFVVKKTDTGTNPITLIRPGSEIVEGVAADFELPDSTNTDRPAWTLLYVGSSTWWIL